MLQERSNAGMKSIGTWAEDANCTACGIALGLETYQRCLSPISHKHLEPGSISKNANKACISLDVRGEGLSQYYLQRKNFPSEQKGRLAPEEAC